MQSQIVNVGHDAGVNHDALLDIATFLGVELRDVRAALGARWTRHEGGVYGALDTQQVLTAGDPMQAMLVVDHHQQTITVARPALAWDGHSPTLGLGPVHAQQQDTFDLEALGDAVSEAARKSRKTFKWCWHCKGVNAPFHMHSSTMCMGCASDYEGIVYKGYPDHGSSLRV